MSDFFDNLYRSASTASSASGARILTAHDGAIAGQNLLNMLQASASPQVAPMPSPPPPPPEDCQADRQLKAILYSGTRALKRESSSKPASLHDMLEGTHRDRSPTRKKLSPHSGIIVKLSNLLA